MDKNCIFSTNRQEASRHNPTYAIKAVSEKTGISIYTLRYYDKEGLFPFLYRNDKNVRVFSEADIEWITLIECLRRCNMRIEDIRNYINLCKQGNSTLQERYAIIKEQEVILQRQIEDLRESLEHIKYKREYYEKDLLNL